MMASEDKEGTVEVSEEPHKAEEEVKTEEEGEGEDKDKHPPDVDLPPARIDVEVTMALVKPDIVDKVDIIEDIILTSGFTILQKRRVHLSAEQACDFYEQEYGKLHFASLVSFMCSGHTVVLLLARDNAVRLWRRLCGPSDPQLARQSFPDCLRAQYGSNVIKNGLHASVDYEEARREVQFFFPDFVVEPLPHYVDSRDYLTRLINPTLLKGLTAVCKEKPLDPITWLADWLMNNNPFAAIINWSLDMEDAALHPERASKTSDDDSDEFRKKCNMVNFEHEVEMRREKEKKEQEQEKEKQETAAPKA